MEIKNYLGEIWRPVKGYEGLYEVSNFGRVKSLNYRQTGKKAILKPQVYYGYLRVALYKNKKQKRFFVHRLVAETFLPNPNNLPEINHKDENKQNNYVDPAHPENSNLEWCSRKYNNTYGSRIKKAVSKTKNGKCSKRVGAFKNGILIQEFPSIMEAYRQGWANFTCISAVCHNLPKYKTAGGYEWKFL